MTVNFPVWSECSGVVTLSENFTDLYHFPYLGLEYSWKSGPSQNLVWPLQASALGNQG